MYADFEQRESDEVRGSSSAFAAALGRARRRLRVALVWMLSASWLHLAHCRQASSLPSMAPIDPEKNKTDISRGADHILAQTQIKASDFHYDAKDIFSASCDQIHGPMGWGRELR